MFDKIDQISANTNQPTGYVRNFICILRIVTSHSDNKFRFFLKSEWEFELYILKIVDTDIFVNKCNSAYFNAELVTFRCEYFEQFNFNEDVLTRNFKSSIGKHSYSTVKIDPNWLDFQEHFAPLFVKKHNNITCR